MNDSMQTVSDRLDRMTRILRGLGALLLLTSASSFLIHRWNAGEDMLRFAFLLAHSFVILGAALFCGGRLGESRSARVFLWTNLALVPAHFAVMGGLVYSQFALDSTTLSLPSYAVWQAPNKLSVLIAAVGTLVTVIPTSLISARVLAPQRAKLITLTYVGLCSLLLVPLRVSDAVALLATAGAIAALLAERRWFAGDYRLRTREGRFVRALMIVPLALLVIRTAAFYPTTLVFIGLLVMVAALGGWTLSQTIVNNRASVEAGEWLSALIASVGSIYVMVGLDAFEQVGPLATLSVPLVFCVASRFTVVSRANFERAAAVSGLFFCALGLAWRPELLEGVLALTVGTVVLAHSILLGRGMIGTASAMLTVAGIGVIFERAIGFDKLQNWGTLSLLGIGVVIAAALLERHRGAIIARMATGGRRGAAESHRGAPEPTYGPRLPEENLSSSGARYSASVPAAGV